MDKMDEMDSIVARTADVVITENVPFSKMFLSDHVLAGLTKCGFQYPSPIQLRAIPIGCCGLDMLVKAKSGTGKTLVFCTLLLEKYDPDIKAPQSLVIVPTREIAEQIKCYLNDIGATSPGFKATSFIGGLDIADDRRAMSSCRAIVGTPGRLLHLISKSVLFMDRIKLLVLDEVDKLLTETFRSDVQKLIRKIPSKQLQIVASSATFSTSTNETLSKLMKNPIGVTASRETPVLLGVNQYLYIMDDDEEWLTAEKYAVSTRSMNAKVAVMKEIFDRVAFKQAIVFSNSQMRADSYCSYLQKIGWKTDVISASYDQPTRLDVFRRFKAFETRILVATDLMARGIDVSNINLVINLDVPSQSATYLHRIGRCGRYGSKGMAVTIIGNKSELEKFNRMLENIGGDQLNVMSFRDFINSNVENHIPKENDNHTSEGSADGAHINGNDDCKQTKGVCEPELALINPQQGVIKKSKGKCITDEMAIETKNLYLLQLAHQMVGEEIEKNNKPSLNMGLNLFDDFYEKKCTFVKQPEVCNDLTNGNNCYNESEPEPSNDSSIHSEVDESSSSAEKHDDTGSNSTKSASEIEDDITETNDGLTNGHIDYNGSQGGIDASTEVIRHNTARILNSEKIKKIEHSSAYKNQAKHQIGRINTLSDSVFVDALKNTKINSNTNTPPILKIVENNFDDSSVSSHDAISSDSSRSERVTTAQRQPVSRVKKSSAKCRSRSQSKAFNPMYTQHNQLFSAWSNIYWNQINYIQNYVQFAQQANYFH